MKDKYVLITNIDYASIGNVRTATRALLLEEWPGSLDGKSLRRRVRGFGTVAEWSVFDIDIPSVKYKLTNVGSGAVLQLVGGPRLSLWVADPDKPIDVLTFASGTGIAEVWEELPRKVAQYWWPAYTNMPLLTWYPSSAVRTLRDGEKGSGA